MENMSYCRFENTFRALLECQEALYELGVEVIEEAADKTEEPYVRKLITLCTQISEEYGND